ncbi:hypothetical protein [Rodentibacter caecimuris]|uniref:hypothetical protein n=1 Tax=Rodentibacter caecimuris TaxID=1796644 RepID=UPI00211A16DC|nr:hypothetical protein [Rodentibacter heylii]MCQ9124678.1 hypothetical protein [Rodentibacter heylii]
MKFRTIALSLAIAFSVTACNEEHSTKDFSGVYQYKEYKLVLSKIGSNKYEMNSINTLDKSERKSIYVIKDKNRLYGTDDSYRGEFTEKGLQIRGGLFYDKIN